MKNNDANHMRKRSREDPTNAEAAEFSEDQGVGGQQTEVKGTKSSSTSRVSPEIPDESACIYEYVSGPTAVSTSGGNSGNSPGSTHPSERKLKQATLPSYGLVNDTAVFRKELADRDAQIDELREKLAAVETRMSERETTLVNTQAQLQEAVDRNNRYQVVLREEMLRAARQERCDARRALHLKQFELGQIAVWHSNGREVWVEGNKMRQLTMQLEELSVRRDEVEELKKTAEKRARQILRSNDEDSMAPEVQAALMEAQEAALLYTAEFAALGSAIQSLKQQQQDLNHEKKVFLKEIRRVNDEDASAFVAVPALGHNGRYVMMHLLGKGGFSEVWKAFDLQEARYVACKIHRVQREWSQQVRQHYRDRAVRELKIMRMLEHPHLTRLFDAFDHGTATFVSVMEFSAGTDLDTHLKRCGTLREVEARLIIMQVVSALRYFAAQHQPVIHYDLKPANILLHSSNQSSLLIKITDFGLSKLIPKRDGTNDNPTIELTSQGAGTYWYLPPECFDTTATPRISNKVDVWSCGVIFYQMLFGRRPFAEGESQQQIWQNKLIVSSAHTLTFPDTPRVSQEAKDLIQKCLEYHPADRYDVMQLSQDPYLQRNTRRLSRTERTLPAATQNSSTTVVTTAAAASGVTLTGSVEEKLSNIP
ncbi:tousled-like kinase I [Trypanosoma brucei equiperdum]|uniref:Tousled-like kinase I n=1 Tax=Trypanosoma brucei equiperdum TaxID=630700 RepID=A0A3L6LBN4_9TRYP|nr:tousled-like kinase I [Trypanosoma brucei equiperdum]